MADVGESGVLKRIRGLFTVREYAALSDRELLSRFVGDGDEWAVTALIERHGAMTLGICRRVLGQSHDAEDACQAAFLVLVRKAGALRRLESLAGWLHRVAYHVAFNLKRELTRRRQRERLAARAEEQSPKEELSWRELQGVLDEELAKLPDKFRAPLVLCYLEGKTQDEAAAQLRWSSGTLRGRLARGREQLRARLSHRGIAFSSALAACQFGSQTVPSTWVLSTVKAVASIRQSASVGFASTEVAALCDKVVRTMFMRKWTTIAALLLVVVGSGLCLCWSVGGIPRADAGEAQDTKENRTTTESGRGQRKETTLVIKQPRWSLQGHKDRVTAVAYSSDGRWVATTSWDATIRIWDARTGKENRRIDVPGRREYTPARLSMIQFTSDNEYLVTAQQTMPDERGVIVWNRKTGKAVREFAGEEFALAPDGKQIATGGHGVLYLHDLASGKRLREMNGPQTQQRELFFLSDGKTVFTHGPMPRVLEKDIRRLGRMPNVLRARDVESGKEKHTAVETFFSEYLAFSPDGRVVVHANGKTIDLREVLTGEIRVTLTGHTDFASCFAFSPNGLMLASSGWDGTVRLWDYYSGKEIGRLEGHEKWVLSVAFSTDGRALVSGGLDGSANIWDVSKITGRSREIMEQSPAQLEKNWKTLCENAEPGSAAMGRLVRSPGRAIAFLEKQLLRDMKTEDRQIERLIAQLDDDEFEVREQASKSLAELGYVAAAAMKKALENTKSTEVKRRLRPLVSRVEGVVPPVNIIRLIRAVEVLEAIGNAEARRVLDKLAAEASETTVKVEAARAGKRLEGRKGQ